MFRKASFVAVIAFAAASSSTQVHAAAIAFNAPTALQGGSGGEPSISLDTLGNVVVGGPQGLGAGATHTPPAGGGAYWISHNDGASWPTTPLYLGGPSGGGDEDNVFSPNDASSYSQRLYIADLAASHSTVCYSADHGATFYAVGPTTQSDPTHCVGDPLGAVSPSSDRQWLTADVGGRAYLTDHEFVSALPRMWTTANGGADQFTNACGTIASDPTILANVPTDITGGTLVSKPVVDSAGNVYVLFTTTTQTQNLSAYGQGIVSGTFSQAYIAVSNDHCATFTDHTIFDGSALGANTVQFGDIFNELVIDPAGNLYAVAAGFIGTVPFAKTADVFIFHSTDHGAHWSAPYQITTDLNAHVLPAAASGPSPGQLAIGYYRTDNATPHRDPNDSTDQWVYTTAETDNALASSPMYQFTDMPAAPGTLDNHYHYGDICTSGTLCGTMVPGTGKDRSLLDFTSAQVDTDGCPFFTFGGNPKSAAAGHAVESTLNYVTKQSTGCFATLATSTPEAPVTLGLVAAGVAAAAAVGWRRRRHGGLPE
jgi:hypothetical protein